MAGVEEGKKGSQRKVLDSPCYKDVGFWLGLATCNLSYLAVLGRKITSSRPALDYRVNSRVTWAAKLGQLQMKSQTRTEDTAQ